MLLVFPFRVRVSPKGKRQRMDELVMENIQADVEVPTPMGQEDHERKSAVPRGRSESDPPFGK